MLTGGPLGVSEPIRLSLYTCGRNSSTRVLSDRVTRIRDCFFSETTRSGLISWGCHRVHAMTPLKSNPQASGRLGWLRLPPPKGFNFLPQSRPQ